MVGLGATVAKLGKSQGPSLGSFRGPSTAISIYVGPPGGSRWRVGGPKTHEDGCARGAPRRSVGLQPTGHTDERGRPVGRRGKLYTIARDDALRKGPFPMFLVDIAQSDDTDPLLRDLDMLKDDALEAADEAVWAPDPALSDLCDALRWTPEDGDI